MYPRIGGPVRGEDQEPGSLGPAGQSGDQGEGSVITPLEILEAEHQRTLRSEPLEGGGHLPQHARLGGAAELLLQRLALGGREERWELSGPRRRVLAEDVDQTRLIDLVREPL